MARLPQFSIEHQRRLRLRLASKNSRHKIALAELTVSQVVLYRFAVAAMALLPFALRRRIRVQVQDIPHFLLAGFLTVPLTFMLQFGG